MEHQIQLNTSEIVGRQELLQFLYNTFANEQAGTPEDVSRYSYYVETLEDNTHIYLRRPAPLNNGIDFTVNSDGHLFLVGKRRMHNPSHSNIYSMLESKRQENEALYDNRVKPLIARIYNVEPLLDNEYRVPGFVEQEYTIEL